MFGSSKCERSIEDGINWNVCTFMLSKYTMPFSIRWFLNIRIRTEISTITLKTIKTSYCISCCFAGESSCRRPWHGFFKGSHAILYLWHCFRFPHIAILQLLEHKKFHRIYCSTVDFRALSGNHFKATMYYKKKTQITWVICKHGCHLILRIGIKILNAMWF